MNKWAALLSAWVIFFKAESQSLEYPPDEFIEWNEYYKLSWDNFKGEPEAGAIGDAGTAVFIEAKPHKEGRNLYYTVRAFFNKRKSWAKDTSDALLRHEQLHFDIAELYARKVRKKLAEFGDLKVKNIKIYNAAIKEILEESNEADRLYDLETLHGVLLKKQQAWEEAVRIGLEELRNYKQ